MRISQPQYISASRRTDIPRFFHQQFFSAWRQGSITYDGGYGRSYTVSLRPDDVLGYIFWSKDFELFIRDPRFRELIASHNAVFHFTINNCPELEPRVGPLEKRLDTLNRLCDLVGPERVIWRFDPICKYGLSRGGINTTEAAFYQLLPLVAATGVSRCHFSFMSLYAKLLSRKARFLSFSPVERQTVSRNMLTACRQAEMELYNCCNSDVPELVPEVRQAHCVDDELLRRTDRFGRHRQLPPKPTREGCGCCRSRDIGSYAQRCRHGCLYCYANPAC